MVGPTTLPALTSSQTQQQQHSSSSARGVHPQPLNHEHLQGGSGSHPNSPRTQHSGSATPTRINFGTGNPLIPTTTIIGLGTVGLGDRCAAERKRMHREQYQQWKRNKEVQQAQERLNNGGLTPKKPLTSKEMYQQARQGERDKQERRLEREMETLRVCREEAVARKSELTQSRAEEHAFSERFLQLTAEERERARAERAAREAAKQREREAEVERLRRMHDVAKQEVSMVEQLADHLHSSIQQQKQQLLSSSAATSKRAVPPPPPAVSNAAASPASGDAPPPSGTGKATVSIVMSPAPPGGLPQDGPKSRRSDAAAVVESNSPQNPSELSGQTSPARRKASNSPTNHMSPKGESIGAISPRVQRQLVHTVMKEYDALYALRAHVAHDILSDALDIAGEAVEHVAKEKHQVVEKCVKQHHRRQKWIQKMDTARETEFKNTAKELKTELVQRIAIVQERLFESHSKDADKIREARSSPRTRSSHDLTAQHRQEEERQKQRLDDRRRAQEMHQAAIAESKESKRAAAGDVRKLKSELAEERTVGSSELLEWKRRLHDDTKAARTRSPNANSSSARSANAREKEPIDADAAAGASE